MGDDEGRAGFQALVNLPERLKAIFAGDEVERQERDGRIERPRRCGLDKPLMQPDTRGMWADRLLGEAQHVGRWVDAIERPVRMRFGKGLELEAATGAEHQHPPLRRHPLRQQHRRHPVARS